MSHQLIRFTHKCGLCAEELVNGTIVVDFMKQNEHGGVESELMHRDCALTVLWVQDQRRNRAATTACDLR
ncbi:hypothetical protein [Mycolicibacterium sp.]|uniref:hypothetical protein n=1 Tax=Mycolicibacterium sp. TaxID=2320850 RepID=UPI003D0F5BE6